MSFYDQFETNKSFEQDGIFVEIGQASNGKPGRFKVARAGGANKNYAKALEKFGQVHRVALETKSMPNDVAEKILLDVFCTTVLLGWENVEGRDGKILPFTKENAVKFLTDLPPVYKILSDIVNDYTMFRKAERESDLKNSQASSNTV